MKREMRKTLAFILVMAMVLTSGLIQGTVPLFAEEKETPVVAQAESEDENGAVAAEGVNDGSSEEKSDAANITEGQNGNQEISEGDKLSLEDKLKGADGASATLKRTEYVYEDKYVKVTAKLSDANALPDDAELVVTPITAKSKGYNYKAYMDALNHSARGKNEKYTDDNTLLYDIAFIRLSADEKGTINKVELQPEKGTVDVSISFKKEQLSKQLDADKVDQVEVKHLPLKKAVKEKYDTTEEAKKLTEKDITVENVSGKKVNLTGKDRVSFKTKGFSAYAVTAKDTLDPKRMTTKESDYYINIVNEDRKNLSGAQIQLLNSERQPLAEIVWNDSDSGPKKINYNLQSGEEYIIHENRMDQSYLLSNDISFSINDETIMPESDSVSISEDGKTMSIIHSKAIFKVSIIDKKTGERLKGVTARIFNKDGTPYGSSWTTADNVDDPYLLSGRLTGTEMILRETEVPEGYAIPDDIIFSIDQRTGSVLIDGKSVKDNIITIENREKVTGDLTVTKKISGDMPTATELTNALKFTVTTVDGDTTKWLDKEGNLSDDPVTLSLSDGFTTNDGGKTYSKTFPNLTEGTYSVVETPSAISGYTLDSTSVLSGEDKISETNLNAKIELENKYTKTPAPTPTPSTTATFTLEKRIGGGLTKAEVEKNLAFEITTTQNNQTMWLKADGTLSLTQVTLTCNGTNGFETADNGKTFTKTFPTVQPLAYKVTEANTRVPGYLLITASSVTSGTLDLTNKESGTVSLYNEYQKTYSINIRNVDQNTKKRLAGAKLQVYEIDAGGKETTFGSEWTSSDKTDHVLSNLVPGQRYIVRTMQPPSGYTAVRDIEFKVNESGELLTANGTKLKDNLLTVEDSKDKDDDDDDDSSSSTTKKKASSSSSSSSSSTRSSTARTGDTNPIAMWAGIAIGGMALILFLIYLLRRKRTE